MTKIAAELMVERLVAWGVRTVFGLPGDGINGLMEALRRNRDKIGFILVHHEEAAAFMASGHAKTTGQIGVCIGTSGPGGIHLLNGLYDARMDHQPVLAITGMQPTKALGTGYQQEVHLEHLFQDVADYNVMITIPSSIPTLVDNAVRTSLSRRTVSHLTFPVDIQESATDEDPWEGGLGTVRAPTTAPVYVEPFSRPRDEQLDRAAAVLNHGKRVVTLVGAGALHAGDQLVEVAGRLASPIVKTLPGKAAVSDDHPLTTGGLGLLGTRPSEEAMERADTLLMVGTNFPYTAFLPEPGKVRCVQIEADPTRAGARLPVEAPLVGDARETLAALLPLLRSHRDRSFLEDVQKEADDWREAMDAQETAERHPIQPQYLMRVIDRLAADDAILSTDSGTVATWAARHFRIHGRREFYLSGNLASMAPALPYAIAHQLAHPGRQCIAFVGDGGFAMLMAEFLTACRYGLPIKVFIDNNGLLGQILWEQMVLGYPEFGVRWERAADFAPWALACGASGIRVDKASELEGAVSSALREPGPALVDVITNPDEPPLPAKVSYQQAKGFAKAFLRGQPRRASIASTLVRDKLTDLRW